MSADPDLRRARNRRYRASHPRAMREFLGVDSEGGGTDEYGRQRCLLFCGGTDYRLFNNNQDLRTRDTIEFLLSLPSQTINVGYYFTYDATMVLRDLPPDRAARLFTEHELGEGHSPYTFWEDYAIDFRPRQYLRVARLNRNTLKIIPGTTRSINEVGGFFQKPFVEALKDWGVGEKAVIKFIAEQKERRAEFTDLSTTEIEYCHLECALLGELMTKLREVCNEAGIMPRQWRGAGWLAARLHELNSTPKRTQMKPRPASLEMMAISAYYGGRFEVTQIGRIPGPIYGNDINSAYPDGMMTLPCPRHTTWKRFKDADHNEAAIFLASVEFEHSSDAHLCHFPIRHKGQLLWPRTGKGIYWSNEIRAAIDAGAKVEMHGGYRAIINCDCRAWEWVREVYNERKRIGKSTKGYPLKLGINGLYGKLAQRQGNAPWRDYISAGLITAACRAKLIRAYSQAPDQIVMLATDALYSRVPLDLDYGDGLGQWEKDYRPNGIFIVQPGIYWSNGEWEEDYKPKTRGIPRSRIIERRDDFERSWMQYITAPCTAGKPPAVAVPITTFVGHRLALARHKPMLAGTWLPLQKSMSYDWSAKRDAAAAFCDETLYTVPKMGGMVSEPYDPAALTSFRIQLMEDEAQPDFIYWGNSGE